LQAGGLAAKEEKRRRCLSTQNSVGGRWRLWGVALALVFGVLVGLSLFTFTYAEGLSYLSDDPTACVNCHVMRDQFTAWNHSSHKAVAVCNDCHAPHDSLLSKYAVKALNGVNHSVRFTLDAYPEPIRITELNRRVAHDNCLGCHGALVSQMHASPEGEGVDCIACHGSVGHRVSK
jgi:cytochrome c nitrite reductase small subunit